MRVPRLSVAKLLLRKTVQWPPLQAGLAGLYAANQVGAVCFFLAAAWAFELHVYGEVQ